MRHDLLDGLKLLLHGVDGRVFGHDVAVVGRIGPSRGLKINGGIVTLYNLIKTSIWSVLSEMSVCVLTNRGDTGMLGRPMRGGGAILCLISPQYSCSSSILCQYMSSSYLLLEETWKCAHKVTNHVIVTNTHFKFSAKNDVKIIIYNISKIWTPFFKRVLNCNHMKN